MFYEELMMDPQTLIKFKMLLSSKSQKINMSILLKYGKW